MHFGFSNSLDKGREMYQTTVTYEDLNGNTVTDTLYFNLTRAEIVEMQVSYPGGYAEKLMEVVKAEDKGQMWLMFKELILAAYGTKSEDGKSFRKDPVARADFLQTLAYDTFFYDLVTNEDSAANFVRGMFPKDIVDQAIAQASPTPTGGPPVPPIPPAA